MRFINCTNRAIKLSVGGSVFEIEKGAELDDIIVELPRKICIEFIDPPELFKSREITKNTFGRIRKTIIRSDIVYLKSYFRQIDDCAYYIIEKEGLNHMLLLSNTLYCYPVITKNYPEKQENIVDESIAPYNKSFYYNNDKKKLGKKFILCFMIVFPLFALSIFNIIYDWFDIGNMLNEIISVLLFINAYSSTKGIAKLITYKDTL